MGKQDWCILYANYAGVEKKAIELLSSEVGTIVCRDAGIYTIRVLPLYAAEGRQTLPLASESAQNCIVIGQYSEMPMIAQAVRPDEIPEMGYFVSVTRDEQNPSRTIVYITAHSSIGVYYGAVDFVDNYLPSAEKLLSNYVKIAGNTFDDALPLYKNASAPMTEKRSIFTWGQPIGDYRAYIDNAARCKINQLIIWNDYLPLNAADIVAYAHEYEMELIWGFAWGWSTNCLSADLSNLDALCASIVQKFKESYQTAGDGIYFQSFTETHEEQIGGVLIAEAVVRLVNQAAAELYRLRPDLHIQFGVHAISVHRHLAYFEALDPRIEIVWEDCGAFPYHYLPKIPDEAERGAALTFTREVLSLRNGGRSGLVYKGLMTLDWTHFAHQSGPYILGVSSQALIDADRAFMTPIWRNFTAEWMRCGESAYDFTRSIHEMHVPKLNLNVAAQLSGGIWFPFALLSEILWSTAEPYEEIVARVARRKHIFMP